MTVNLGQGANCAMEDVVVLTNLLDEMLKRSSKEKKTFSDSEINDLLARFNQTQLPRASRICETAWSVARTHTRDGFIKKLVGRFALPYLTFLVEGQGFSLIADAASINAFPVPRASFGGWTKYSSNQGIFSKPVVVLSAALVLVACWKFTQRNGCSYWLNFLESG